MYFEITYIHNGKLTLAWNVREKYKRPRRWEKNLYDVFARLLFCKCKCVSATCNFVDYRFGISCLFTLFWTFLFIVIWQFPNDFLFNKKNNCLQNMLGLLEVLKLANPMLFLTLGTKMSISQTQALLTTQIKWDF